MQNNEDITVIEDEETDLLSQLKEATEFKTPVLNDILNKSNKSFFEITDDKAEEIVTGIKKSTENKNEIKSSKKDSRASGETAAAMVELVTSLIAEAVVSIRYNRKYKDNEKSVYEAIQDVKKDTLKAELLALREKGDRINKEKARKYKEIEISEKARTRMENSLVKYFEISNTELSPGWLLAASIAETSIKTILTACTD